MVEWCREPRRRSSIKSPLWSGNFRTSCNFPSLLWLYNGLDGVSNHQPNVCWLKRLFRRRSKETSKLRVTGLCVGNSPGTGEFPAQRASNAENVSIWWRHHVITTHLSKCLVKMMTRSCNVFSGIDGYNQLSLQEADTIRYSWSIQYISDSLACLKMFHQISWFLWYFILLNLRFRLLPIRAIKLQIKIHVVCLVVPTHIYIYTLTHIYLNLCMVTLWNGNIFAQQALCEDLNVLRYRRRMDMKAQSRNMDGDDYHKDGFKYNNPFVEIRWSRYLHNGISYWWDDIFILNWGSCIW